MAIRAGARGEEELPLRVIRTVALRRGWWRIGIEASLLALHRCGATVADAAWFIWYWHHGDLNSSVETLAQALVPDDIKQVSVVTFVNQIARDPVLASDLSLPLAAMLNGYEIEDLDDYDGDLFADLDLQIFNEAASLGADEPFPGGDFELNPISDAFLQRELLGGPEVWPGLSKPVESEELDWVVLPQDALGQPIGGGAQDWMREYRRAAVHNERLQFIKSLGPWREWVGLTFGKRQYHVALFPVPGVAVAESVNDGNALYYVAYRGDSWQSVFKLTKLGAIRAGARRIRHQGDWKRRVKEVIRSAR